MPFWLSLESSPGDLLGTAPGPTPYEGGGTGDSSNPDGGDSWMNPGRGTFLVLADAGAISVALPDAASASLASSWRERLGSPPAKAALSEWIAKLGFPVLFFLADVERRGSVLPTKRGLLVGVVSGLAGRMPAAADVVL